MLIRSLIAQAIHFAYGATEVALDVRYLIGQVEGILGLQLFADSSEEDDAECLGIVRGTSRKLEASPRSPVPNMGWCRLRLGPAHPILADIEEGSFFYFVHSYALPVSEHTVASASHAEPFSAIARNGNFIAAQFHPERSSKTGARLLRNFVSMNT